MRHVFLLVVMIVALVGIVGCGNDDAEEARQVPVQWALAAIQVDDTTRSELLAEPNDNLDPEQGPEHSDYDLEEYQLVECAWDDDTFLYEIYYYNERNEEYSTHQMEVIRTDEGWKKDQYGDTQNFEQRVNTVDCEFVRELNE